MEHSQAFSLPVHRFWRSLVCIWMWIILLGFVVAPQSLSMPCTQPPSDMVAWWPLDETSGPTANDIGGYVNNSGTWMNGPTPVPGKVAGALSFNGANYVDVPDHPELDFGEGNLTIDAWIFPTNLSGIIPIVDKREDNVQAHGYTLFLSNSILAFELAVDNRPDSWCGPDWDNACQNYSSGVSIPINTWTHVAVTVDRDESAGGLFYVNGVNVASFNPLTQAGDISNAGDLWIGRRHPVDVAPTSYFYGSIDEVELFNRVLTPDEVHDIWNADSAGKCKCATPAAYSMVAWWPLDDTTGATMVKDIAVVGNHPGTPGPDGSIGVGYAPYPVVGKVGDALYFWQNGVYRTHVSVASQPDIEFGNNMFSIDAWVKITQYSGTDLQPIVEKMQYNGTTPELGYRFYLESGYLSFILAWGFGTAYTIQVPFQISQAVWHHVAVTVERHPVDGATVTLYIDGTPLLPTIIPALTTQSIANTEALIMGAIAQPQPPPVNYLDIYIDELELFDTLLTDQDVILIYQADSLGKCKAELSGMKFYDHNCNGEQDPFDYGLDNWTIFIDTDYDEVFDDPGEPYTTTDQAGNYSFTVPAPGSYTICEVNQLGWTQTFPDPIPCHSAQVVAYQIVTDLDFGNCGCEPCENNIVQNWSFIDGAIEGPMPSGQTDHWTLAYGTPDVHIGNACCDSACVTMWGNQYYGEAIQQTLAFVQGQHYAIKYCAFWPHLPGHVYPVQFEFRASILPLISPTDPNGVTIGVSPPIMPEQQWIFSMPAIKWKATDDYSILTVSATNQSSYPHGDSTSAGRIDRICIYEYTPGDVNMDSLINIGDVVYLISYLYRGGPEPSPLEAGDCDCNGIIDLGDLVYLISYLYRGGPPPSC